VPALGTASPSRETIEELVKAARFGKLVRRTEQARMWSEVTDTMSGAAPIPK
jgi:hypothetical protein